MKDQQYIPYNGYSPNYEVSEKEVKDVKATIKSCIVTRKGGMPMTCLREDYKQVTDEDIPYLKLGYNSLFHLLRDIPEIKSKRNEKGEPVLVVENNPKTKHLQELIKKQKDPKTYMRLPKKRRENRRDKTNRHQIFDTYRNISQDKKEVEAPVDENWGKPLIYDAYDLEKNKGVCAEPVVGTSQLIGDDYFLQLCIKYLSAPLERMHKKSAITCGTVQSGLTIKKAAERLDNIRIMSNKLVINVGTVDIYYRSTVEEMIEDYEYLLNKLEDKYGYSPSQITLCTLPPMGNVGLYETGKYSNHASFNNWLRDYALENNYKLLDLHQQFTDSNKVIDYECFQQDARMVSGCKQPHVLWNYWGRQKAMKLLLNLH